MAKKKFSISTLLLFIILLPVSALMLPTLVFLFIALLPTIVAIAVDNAARGYKWVCILGVNLAGSIPFLFNLWMGVHDMEAVMDIILNVTNMIIIYGSAAIGWLLYVFIPPVIVSIISVTDHNKVKQLKKTQEKLVQKWGEEVKKS